MKNIILFYRAMYRIFLSRVIERRIRNKTTTLAKDGNEDDSKRGIGKSCEGLEHRR